MIGVGGDGAVGPRPASRAERWDDLDLRSIDAERDRPFWIALSLLPGLGPVAFARLLHRYGSAEAAWRHGAAVLDALERIPDGGEVAARRLLRERPASLAQSIQKAVRACGGHVVTAMDDGYPAALSELHPRPPLLYVAGDLSALDAVTVAIVGTRRATGYGRAATAEIADELASAGVTVVSGLARGVDAEAHRVAIAAGGRSAAVLPSPLDRVYPPAHEALARELVRSGGVLLTEVPPGQPIGRPDFARRNRIIAALASAVVVVEAPDRSGALLTASAATALQRELYAVPGPIDAVASRGCNRLIADQQATLVTSAASLLQRLGVPRSGQPVVVRAMSDAEGLVLGRLLRRSASIEELLQQTRLSTASVASALSLLEARGLATAYGGATFHPTLAARRLGSRT